jgi:hypothetical protein
VSGWREACGHTPPDHIQGGGRDEACADQVVGSALVAAVPAVEEQVGLGSEHELGPACRHGTQDRPVASADGARSGLGAACGYGRVTAWG